MTSGIYRFQPSLSFFGWCHFSLEYQRYRQFSVLSVISRFNRQSNRENLGRCADFHVRAPHRNPVEPSHGPDRQ